MKVITFIFTVLFTLLSFQSSADTHCNGDKTHEKAVNYYLEGSLLGDLQIIAKAFHPDATV